MSVRTFQFDNMIQQVSLDNSNYAFYQHVSPLLNVTMNLIDRSGHCLGAYDLSFA